MFELCLNCNWIRPDGCVAFELYLNVICMSCFKYMNCITIASPLYQHCTRIVSELFQIRFTNVSELFLIAIWILAALYLLNSCIGIGLWQNCAWTVSELWLMGTLCGSSTGSPRYWPAACWHGCTSLLFWSDKRAGLRVEFHGRNTYQICSLLRRRRSWELLMRSKPWLVHYSSPVRWGRWNNPKQWMPSSLGPVK